MAFRDQKLGNAILCGLIKGHNVLNANILDDPKHLSIVMGLVPEPFANEGTGQAFSDWIYVDWGHD